MNLSLLDPFNHKFPEVVTQKLGEGHWLFSQYSPSGHYLLCGGDDGSGYILDTITYGLVRVLNHPGIVTCMSMTKDNRYVITGADTNSIKIWDVLELKELFSYESSSSVTSVCVNSLNGKQYAAAFAKDTPIMIHFEKGFDYPPTITPLLVAERDAKSKSLLKNSGSYTSIAIDPTSSYVLCGTLKGTLFMYQISSPQIVLSKKVSSSPITQIVFHPNCREFLLNCRISIHLFSFQSSPLSVKELNRFTDQIDKHSWSQCGFDHTGDYVVGGISSLAEHIMHVWLKSSGTLEKFLEGPKEGLRHFSWHPTLPHVISTSTVGNTYFWEPTYPQLWSAFAPKFIELEENVEYMEKEDEFDVVLPSNGIQKDAFNAKNNEGEDDVVDIETVNHLLYNANGQDIEEVLLDVQIESNLECPQPLKASDGPKKRKDISPPPQDELKSTPSPSTKPSSIPQLHSQDNLNSLSIDKPLNDHHDSKKLSTEEITKKQSSPKVKQEPSKSSRPSLIDTSKHRSSPSIDSPSLNRPSSSASPTNHQVPRTPVLKHKISTIDASPKLAKKVTPTTPIKNKSPLVSNSTPKQRTPERFKPSSQLKSSPISYSPSKPKHSVSDYAQRKSSPNPPSLTDSKLFHHKADESDEEGELHSNDEISPPDSRSKHYYAPPHQPSRSMSHSSMQHGMPHPPPHHSMHYGMRPPNSQNYWYGYPGHQQPPPHMPPPRPREALGMFGGFYPQKPSSARPPEPIYKPGPPSGHGNDKRAKENQPQDSEIEEGEIEE